MFDYIPWLCHAVSWICTFLNFWEEFRFVGLDFGIISIEMLFKATGLDSIIKRGCISREKEVWRIAM